MKQVIQFIQIIFVGNSVGVVFMWEESPVPRGNPQVSFAFFVCFKQL